MKIKTSELTDGALDYAVHVTKGNSIASCEYWREKYVDEDRRDLCERYSTDWAQGGPIIERERIEIKRGNPLYFPQGNEVGDHYEPLWIAGKQHGRTPLVAAMRYYVASKFGDEIEIPKELL